MHLSKFAGFATLLLVISHAVIVHGQVSADEAYRRLQARIAARNAATSQPSAAEPSTPLPTPPVETPPTTAPAAVGDLPAEDSALLKARKDFHTAIRPDAKNPQDDHGERPALPPEGVARLTHYRSPIGLMNAYVTLDPHDGRRHPAVLWIHGGWGGLGPDLFSKNEPADNDQTATAFVDAKLVVMCPGFRGHNDDPGTWEMFYGEVDDAVAAVNALAKLPYVDPTHIYVAGHSTGGTMALLVAEATTHVRAAFSLGGCADVQELISSEADHHHAPFDFTNPQEGRLRSAVNFVDGLKTPTWYFDQADSFYARGVRKMNTDAARAHAPFHAFTISPATHFDMCRPITQLIAEKLQADAGPTCNISITPQDVAAAYGKVFGGRAEDVTEMLSPTALPAVRVTELAKQLFVQQCARLNADPKVAALVIQPNGDDYKATVIQDNPGAMQTIEDNGVHLTAPDDILRKIGPFTLCVSLENNLITMKIVRGSDAVITEPNVTLRQ